MQRDIDRARDVTLFLCGDVMTGRGVDQILHHPSAPHLYESYVHSALGYVTLAEEECGPLPRGVAFDYVWGDAIAELDRVRPDARIINLETAITVAEDAWPDKGIHYRMHPANGAVLAAANIDCCVLANNHVLDWGQRGLLETFDVLDRLGIRYAGAGRDQNSASAPATITLSSGRRVFVLGLGAQTSGVPQAWAATRTRPGVNFLVDYSTRTCEAIARQVHAVKQSDDLAVASIHWGDNWGYGVSDAERRFAQRLVDTAGIDVVHGHSSHHPKGIEVYRNKLILYGCGDFLNDYEGIGGHAAYRSDLTLMYFPTVDSHTGELARLLLTPMRIHRFRLNRASTADTLWLLDRLNLEGGTFGTSFALQSDGTLALAEH